MALENLIEKLIETIAKNTEVTTQLISLRADAIESTSKAAAPAAKASTAKAEKAATAAAAAAEPAAAAPAETPAAAAPAVSEAVYAELATSIGAYIGAATREEERAARKDKVKALLNHPAIKKEGLAADAAPDTKNIKDDAIQTFKDNMQMLIDKGDLTQPAASSTALV